MAYIIVLTALVSIVTVLMLNRSDIDATALRVPGQLYSKTEDGRIQNLYNILLVNKTFESADLEIRLRNISDGEITIAGGDKISIGSNSTKELTVFVALPQASLTGAKTEIVFEVIRNGEVVETSSTNFLGPFSF